MQLTVQSFEVMRMNLIVCEQDCRHQQDGCCALNQVMALSGSLEGKCGYYQKLDRAAPSLPEDFKGLGKVAHRD